MSMTRLFLRSSVSAGNDSVNRYLGLNYKSSLGMGLGSFVSKTPEFLRPDSSHSHGHVGSGGGSRPRSEQYSTASRVAHFEREVLSSAQQYDTDEDAVTLVGGEPPTPKQRPWGAPAHHHGSSVPSSSPGPPAASRSLVETRPRSAINGGVGVGQKPPGGPSAPTQPQQAFKGYPSYSAVRLPRLELQAAFDPVLYDGASTRNAWLPDADPSCKVGLSSVKGRRLYMEDECKVVTVMEAHCPCEHHQPSIKTSFWGIFDGHAGGRCSKALAQTLAPSICKDPDFHTDIKGATYRGFQKANAEFLKKADKYQMNDGSTAATALCRDGRLWVANVGDSRVVLCAKGKAVPLSQDHKPNRPDERRRIMALGGKVVNCFGVARVNGVLAVARAFGNRTMRSVIRADPEIQER
jgi:serine/threonine protein phosphatase PrpC